MWYRRPSRSKRLAPTKAVRSNTGAVAVEVLLCMLILMALTFAIVELGIMFFSHALMMHTTVTISRQMALNVSGATISGNLAALTAVNAESYHTTSFGVHPDGVSFSAEVRRDANGNCTLVLDGQRNNVCTICMLFPPYFLTRTHIEQLIEDECFSGDCT